MAIFLIKDRDATHWNPVVEIRSCYKLGDIVEVFEDTKPCVLPPEPPFWLVKITEVTKAQAEHLMDPEQTIDENGYPKRTRRRLYHLSQADIPAAVWTTLQTTRSLGFTEIGQPALKWTLRVRQYIKNKATGEAA